MSDKLTVKVLHRPATVAPSPELESEFRAGRWVRQRLLDFEFDHQARLDEVCPRLAVVGRILAKLRKRDRWRERAAKGTWVPPGKPGLRARLENLREQLRRERNADPRWKAALGWPRDKADEKTCRRKAGETDEEFEARQAKAYRTRREVHALMVYAERRCHWATFNAEKAAVDQALKSVLARRKAGLPADLRRPRWSDPGRIVAQASNSGFEILERGEPWWTMRSRLHDGWVTFRAKIGNCLLMPDDAEVRVVELCRERDGNRWKYSVSLTVRASWPATVAPLGDGIVGIDTGHRTMGDELRAFVWYGSDGRSGEVRLPAECAANIELAAKAQAKIDEAFEKLGTGHRNRHRYRKHLMRLGVRTEEQASWLRWEIQQERRIARLRRRARNLRHETYIHAVRDLRRRYNRMAIDVVGKSVQRLQTDEQMPHAIRRRRDLVAAYSLKVLCERFGIVDLKVTARNSTAECPRCGHLRETKGDLFLECGGCELRTDQDHSAAYVMMCRGVHTARDPDGKLAESEAA